MDREMERALELDGEKLEQMTGSDHGPWTLLDVIPAYYWEDPPNVDFSDEASLDDAAREAIERANGGPIPWGQAEHAAFKADYLDQQALMRVIGMISIADHKDAADAARFTSIKQAATETPADFVKRIALALLNQMAGLE